MALNEARPAKLRYGSKSDLVRHFTNRANGMLEFAAKLGLITPEEGEAIVREVAARHTHVSRTGRSSGRNKKWGWPFPIHWDW
jgi:hypothetical protein